MSNGLESAFSKVQRAERRGEVAEARRLLTEMLARYPNNRKAAEGLARLDPANRKDDGTLQSGVAAITALYAKGDLAQAARDTETLIVRFPQVTALHGIAGAAYLGMGDAVRADRALRKALAAHPDDAINLTNLGVALRRRGQLEEAERCHVRAIEVRPDHAEAHYNLANLLGAQGREEEAIAAYRASLSFKVDHADALYNLGNLLRERTEHAAAAECYRRAFAVRPGHGETLNNLGYTHLQLGERDAAVAAFRQAVAAKPDVVKFHTNLGTALTLVGVLDEARVAYARALELRPDDAFARAQLLFFEAQLCDWSKRDSFAALPVQAVPGREPVPPFLALPFEDDPARQLAWSHAAADALLPAHEADVRFAAARSGAKIRIGYFSSDFYNHATLYLLAGLLREHDRARFEIHAYSFGSDTNDDVRQRLTAQLDGFHDLCGVSDARAVDLVRGHGLDIAIDLKGHTRDARLGLFARRMAPVQIGYLGYPGSIGADFLDYIVADPVVIPPGQEVYFSEQVIRLAGSYQPNDDQRAIGTCSDDRTALGLPATGFVFCSFNQHWKTGPREFTIWMRLLKAAEGSVLWLIHSSPWAQANLQVHAATHGVDPARLIFAAKTTPGDHLARHRHADLFLDSFVVNAHTTASDALWMGLPVLTLPGRQFAARVGASLLIAIDLPELIAASEAEYEGKALELARDPAKLAAIKARLAANRTSTPLFDTAGYARGIEAAFAAVHRRRLDGLPPAPIALG